MIQAEVYSNRHEHYKSILVQIHRFLPKSAESNSDMSEQHAITLLDEE